MKITPTTKYNDFSDVEQYLEAGEKERIVEAAARCYLGEGGFYSLTASQLIRLCKNDIGALDSLPIEVGTVYCVYFFSGLRDFVENYIKTLAALQPQQTPMEQRAANGCVKVSFGESLLVFIRDYFCLNSFSAAEAVTLDEVLVAKRDAYNRCTFERNVARTNTKKAK